MAVTELKLTDTIGQMRDKINEIINTIDGKSVKISSDNGEVVTLTVSDSGHLIATKGNTEVTLTNFGED